MTEIAIYRPGTPPTLQATVQIDERTIYSHKLLGEHNIVAEFHNSSVLAIQIGDYITFSSANYYINRVPDIVKVNNTTFKYTVIFESSLYNLNRKLFISSDGLADYSYNGTATDFITNIVASINTIDPGWTVGTVDTSDYKTLQFSNESCRAALTRVAEAFKMEFVLVGKAISLLNSAGTDTAYTFQYGKNLGLYKLTRQQVNDQNIITKVYGFGGTKNIPSTYRSRAKRLVFEVTGNRYLTKNTDLYGTIEGQFTDDDIYPQRSSVLTDVNMVFDSGSSGTDFNPRTSYIEDTTIDFDINDYLIEGMVAKVVFKSGDLSGVECEIWKYDNTNKRIYINPSTDRDGYSHTLIDMAMPESYITTAETALQAATQAYLDENCVPQVVYSVDIDPKYAVTNSVTLNPGDKVTVIDTDLGINSLIRIAAIEYPLVNVNQIKAIIADFVPYTLQERLVQRTINTRKETVFVDRRQAELARRNAVRQKQLKDLLFDTDGYFDPVNIKPLSIETTYLAVGAKSQNFRLSGVTIEPNHEGDANEIVISAGSFRYSDYWTWLYVGNESCIYLLSLNPGNGLLSVC